MKRKQEAELRQALEDQHQRVVDASHWVLPAADDSVQQYVIGACCIQCYLLSAGW